MFERGWSDGLPLVPPTEERVLRMLDGTSRDPQEVVGLVPPGARRGDGREDRDQRGDGRAASRNICRSCWPRSRPCSTRALRCTACWRRRCLSGRSSSSTARSAASIGMNAKGNALGQGNRANASIGRALQLVIRNVGGGRPQEVDRATLGNPGKYTYCFAEDEEGSCWEPLSVERGVKPGRVGGDGVRRLWPAGRRRPEIARSRRACRAAWPSR